MFCAFLKEDDFLKSSIFCFTTFFTSSRAFLATIDASKIFFVSLDKLFFINSIFVLYFAICCNVSTSCTLSKLL